MNKYLIVSPNGYGNVGDDICAYSGKYAIEQIDGTAEVRVTQPPMKKNLIEWADYVILSGGGILYDRAEKNVNNYMQYIDTAIEMGKKAAVLGVGVQGIVTDEGRRRYVESLSKCEFVSVRTEKDRELLAEIGFKDAIATFDIAFHTSEMVKTITPRHNWLQRRTRNKLVRRIDESQKPKIGICMINLRMLKRDSYPDSVFEQFDEGMEQFIANASDAFDIYMLQHAKEDGELMSSIAKKYGATFVPYKNINDLPLLYHVFEQLDLMVGVRLHSIALGVMSGTPTIGVGSNTAKQKRLADYALPTLQKQFYDFTRVSELLDDLGRINSDGSITQKPITGEEHQKVTELNNKNIELLKKMIT